MGKTAVPPRAYEPAPELEPRARAAVKGGPLWQVLELLASLRLTVTLFWLAFVLVFLGTVAMKDEGIWTVVDKVFRTNIAWIPYQVFVRFGQVFFGVSETLTWPGSFPFPGGWLIGGALFTNLLAAHIVRFKLTWKRAGIYVLHTGIVVMMLGEWLTGMYAVEGVMVIEEGETANHLLHPGKAELAVISTADPKTDHVVVVPASILRKGGVLRHDLLPFDVEVSHYMVNSGLVPAAKAAGGANPATTGLGLHWVARELPEVSGVDTKQMADAPSAYAVLKDKATGQPLGTYLFTALRGETQPVSVGGKSYDVALRLKRTYKPYSLELKEFRFDRYQGTNTPMNYSSRVRVRDPERGEDREVLIRMNEPLWHRDETFFQASFNEVTEKGTRLQVVRNPGWAMPYLSCGLVALGMLVHFGMHLVSFLRLRAVR